MAIQASSEFVGLDADIRIDLDSNSWEEGEWNSNTPAFLSIQIDFHKVQQVIEFSFSGVLDSKSIRLGPYLVNTSVTLPCSVELISSSKIEAIGDCRISAYSIKFSANDLILRGGRAGKHLEGREDGGLFVDARKVEGHVLEINRWGREIEIRCIEQSIQYPLAQYSTKIPRMDPQFIEKYRRVRRILTSFASHKKGSLAKLSAKIENKMVIPNELGRRILRALRDSGVLYLQGQFYFIDQDKCDQLLGVSWLSLRRYECPDKLRQFLADIE